MTDADRQLDRLLAEGGARWRAAQPAAREPDAGLLVGSRRLSWPPLAAAAAVLVLVAGIVAVAATRRAADPPPPATGPADDIVRAGDTVAGEVFIFAPPGRPVRLCGPVGGPRRVLTEPWPDPLNTPELCRNALTVTGLDLARLSYRKERDGAVWGSARVEGVYRARTLTVTRQEDYVGDRKDVAAPDAVPCPEPAGGWLPPPGDVTGAAATRLAHVINQHLDELNEVYVTYPYGWHLQDQSNGKGTMVFVVNTTGDVAKARRMLEAVFPAEHLCVRKATWSAAQMTAAVRELETSAEAKRLNVAAGDKDPINDRLTAKMLVIDQPVARLLDRIAGGRLVPDPVLEKVR